MNKAFDFQKTYLLKAQSPMIHFQYNAAGACLRTTEVKPKFDRFLIRKFRQQKIDFSAWRCSKDHEALDYQMTLKAGTDLRRALTIRDFPIYYGNMGNNNNAAKDIIFRDCSMKITCFHHELREQIDRYIGDFFIVTNFGTMQDKGFGSFLVDGEDSSPEFISKCLRDEYNAQKCYTFSAGDAVTAFKRIKSVYALMKSGINHRGYSRSLLFDYMHYEIKENGTEISIGNEKAWLKQTQIAPAKGRQTNQHDNRSYYVRALLGIGDHVEFLNNLNNRHDKTTVSIKEEPVRGEVTLERFPSPILFKVIGDAVYYVGQRIHPDIYDKRFLFQSPRGQGYLNTPPLSLVKENFIDDFLDYCYYWFTDPNKSPLAIFDDTKNISIKEV